MPIGPGGIAFTSFNADTNTAPANTKSFSFVLLSTALRGQTINFTDNGWLAAGGFRGGEGTVTFTVPADAALGSVFTVTSPTSGTFNPAGAGDAILAYTGTAASPTFLAAVDFADGNTAFAADATSSNTSAVPTGLTLGSTALAFGPDNGTYTGSLTGTVEQILANIANTANWTTNDTVVQAAPASFAVQTSTIAGATPGDDILTGTVGNNVIDGLDGSDILNGGDGDDQLIGGLGDDQLNGDDGFDTMTGGQGNDVYSVDSASDSVVEASDEGIDYIKTTLASYTLPDNVEILSYRGTGDFSGIGNALDNGLYGGDQADNMSGEDGNDTISTDAGADILSGGNGNDRLFGGAGADILLGDAGDDELHIDNANDIDNGGSGTDTLFIDAAIAYVIALDIENVTVTTAGPVNITLNASDNIFDGGAGDNVASGGDGSDLLAGRGGNDNFNGDGGTDTLRGGDGADTLNGGTGNDILDGGDGNDFLFGGDDDDFLNGNAGGDQMDGGAGNDIFIVENFSDSVIGGDGTDTILLQGVAAFTVAGDVEIVDAVSNVGASVNLGDNDNIFGASVNGGLANLGGGNDSFFGRGATDNVNAGAGNDRVNGYGGVDALLGDAGNDVLEGGDGDDTLGGGADDDTLYGEAGNDSITGGAGRDYLSGGSGADFFDFLSVSDTGATAATADRIVDFDGSQGDQISLQTIDADTTIADNQAFTFIGNADFSNVAGQLRYEQFGSNTFVQGDVDGDGVADFVIQLDGLVAPVASDFLL